MPSSIFWIARVSAGWLTLQISAALVKFSVLLSARKYRISCSSMTSPPCIVRLSRLQLTLHASSANSVGVSARSTLGIGDGAGCGMFLVGADHAQREPNNEQHHDIGGAGPLRRRGRGRRSPS